MRSSRSGPSDGEGTRTGEGDEARVPYTGPPGNNPGGPVLFPAHGATGIVPGIFRPATSSRLLGGSGENEVPEEAQTDFYSSYFAYKDYPTPSLSKKDTARFDAEIWKPAGFSEDMRCLEIGSGRGVFLAYLDHKGVADFRGIDQVPELAALQPEQVADRFLCRDAWQYLEDAGEEPFDRVVLLDVLEHFTPDEGFRLLLAIKKNLSDRGKIVIKVPNASSPWGMNFQVGDLTHKSAYNADSLRQMATACNLHVDAVYEQRYGTRRRMITDAILNRFLSWMLLISTPLWGANIYCILSLKEG